MLSILRIQNMRSTGLPDRIPVIYQKEMADIKYLLRIMIKLKILVLLFELAMVPTLCTLSSINPANYIWIDYQNQIPVTYKGSGTYTTSLPCATRIGKCSYNFAVLPPGWYGTRDGTLTIPQSDATKSGIFSIQGDFSELTGEKISADLIVKIQNGLLSAIDKAEYYQKNGYTLPPTDTSYKTTKYDEGFLVKNLPDGFPSVAELERKISQGDISSITSTINDVLNRYAPCRSMINYLTEVKTMMNRIVSNNSQAIKKYNDEIQQIEDSINTLQKKKQAELVLQDSATEVVAIRKNIDAVSEEIVKLRFNESISKEQAQKNIDVLNQYPINVGNLSSTELKDTISEIVKTSKELENSYNDRIKLKKSILQGKLKKQTKDVAANFSAPIETAYNKNSQAIVNANIYLINNDVKSDNTEFLKADTNGYIGAINKKLDLLDTPPALDLDTIKLIQTENMLLNKNIEYLATFSKFNSQGCK